MTTNKMNLNELAYQLKEQGLSYIQIGFIMKQISGKFDYFVSRPLYRVEQSPACNSLTIKAPLGGKQEIRLYTLQNLSG